MAYPNVERWSALQDGRRIPIGEDGKFYVLSVVDCGELVLPTGQLLACDPFAFMRRTGNPCMTVPPGRYRVTVTLADVSGAGDGSHMREAYATLLLDEAAEEVSRRIVTPLYEGQCPPEMTEDGEYHGFPVDAGTACFVDGGALATGMPDNNWLEEVFENDSPDCWFERMDDPSHIRAGLANVPLPLAKSGENIVIVHSGWGDGHFPVVGGYDAAGRLVRVHIDFMVV
jgi:Protein of unknown function (DUF4241)